MSFEDLDGGGDDPLADLSLDLFADDEAGGVAVSEIADLSKAAEAELVMTGDSIETNICSDIPIGEKIITRMEEFADDLNSGMFRVSGGAIDRVIAKKEEQRTYRATTLTKTARDVLYVDIETAPDWDRFDSFGIDRPSADAKNETPRMMMPTAADTVAMTVDKLKELIARQNPDAEWLDHIAEEEAKGKARKGFLDAIRAGKEAKDSYGKFIKQLSVNPMFCRMVCIGWAHGSKDPDALPCLAAEMEKIAIERFWEKAFSAETIIGFKNRTFDIPAILFRSIVHGIAPSIMLDLRKYGSANVLDLMELIYPDLSKTRGLKDTCRILGIDVESDCDGSEVNKLVEDPTPANIDRLKIYQLSDVRCTQELHRKKLAGYFCV